MLSVQGKSDDREATEKIGMLPGRMRYVMEEASNTQNEMSDLAEEKSKLQRLRDR